MRKVVRIASAAALLAVAAIAEAGPDRDQALVRLCNELTSAIAEKGHPPPALADRTVKQLTHSSLKVADLPPELLPLYWRTLAYAAPVVGDLPLALRANAEWRRLAPAERMAGRNELLLHWLAGDRERAAAAVESLTRPEWAEMHHWLAYVGRLVPLAGAKPAITLTLADNSEFALPNSADRLAVLHFWTAAGGPATFQTDKALAEMHKDKPLTLVGVNLDTPANVPLAKTLAAAAPSPAGQFYQADHPDNLILPKPFDVTTTPTFVVIDRDGQVLWAGNDTWGLHTAIHFGLAKPPAASRPPSQPATQPARVEPPPPTAADPDEAAAARLYNEGLDLLRLGTKAHNALFAEQGRAKLRECVEKYPDTPSGQRAAEALWQYR